MPAARNQAKPLSRPLAEDEPRADDRDERLDLLEDDGRDGVAVDERLREEDRRDRGSAHADHDGGRDVARACAADGHERGRDQRKRQEHEHEVLAEHDRRGLRRLRERLSQQGVGSPERRRDRDEDRARDRDEPSFHGRERTDVGGGSRYRSSPPPAFGYFGGMSTRLIT